MKQEMESFGDLKAYQLVLQYKFHLQMDAEQIVNFNGVE